MIRKFAVAVVLAVFGVVAWGTAAQAATPHGDETTSTIIGSWT